jgi:ribosomal protein S18 acetylase RimI-like enzyme
VIVDEVAEAVCNSFEVLAGRLPGGWSRRGDDSVIFVTGLPVPTLNGAITYSPDLLPAALAEALDEVGAQGLPYSLQFPAGNSALVSLAGELGLRREADIPLMWLEGAPSDSGPSGTTVRRLAAAEAMLHAEVAARGFEAPIEVFAAILSATVSTPEVAMYAAEVDGQAVATGLGIRRGDSVGVCNVATPPEFRRRGYGAAVTAAIVNEAIDDGARWAWLQSSSDGYNLYQRLGFTTVATWECWITG